MELYARTGAVLINNEVERPYLKKPKKRQKMKIEYTNLITLKETSLDQRPKAEFFGVELPIEEPISEPDFQEVMPEEIYNKPVPPPPQDKDSLFFMTQA